MDETPITGGKMPVDTTKNRPANRPANQPANKNETTRRDTPGRSARLGLRATPAQEAILRQAAEVAHKSLTDFILDSACQAAEQTLLDQRLFLVSGARYAELLALLDRPAADNPGLQRLFSKPPPWPPPWNDA